jgi:cytidine deaminase
MQTKELRILVRELTIDEAKNSEYGLLIAEAREAAKSAYAPYSHFFVGAAVMLENGVIIRGNNQENAAYPSGLCAERVALFYANATYPEVAVKMIAITATDKAGRIHEDVSPCGSCRQVMLESEAKSGIPITVILDGEKSIRILEGIESLLPLSFKPENLK